jgi:uncharacterized protein (DUF2237 family)
LLKLYHPLPLKKQIGNLRALYAKNFLHISRTHRRFFHAAALAAAGFLAVQRVRRYGDDLLRTGSNRQNMRRCQPAVKWMLCAVSMLFSLLLFLSSN